MRNKSLNTALKCLFELAKQSKPVRTIDIAAKLEISNASASRALKTFQEMGFVSQDSQRRYILGAAAFALSAHAFRGSKYMKGAIKKLSMMLLDCTAVLGVVHDDNVIYLYHKKENQKPLDALVDYSVLNVTESAIGLHHNYLSGLPLPSDSEDLDSVFIDGEILCLKRHNGIFAISVVVSQAQHIFLALTDFYEDQFEEKKLELLSIKERVFGID
ncbi:helix-turn-helix domain-containing protein [Vibrio mediterranei]